MTAQHRLTYPWRYTRGPVTTKAKHLAALLAIVGLAHFVPLERASIAPDDFQNLHAFRDTSWRRIVPISLEAHQRPIHRAFVFAQAKTIGDRATWGLLALLISSSALMVAVYLFFGQVCHEPRLAFLMAALFAVLPQTVEVYHTPIFVNVNLVTALYVMSATWFITYLRTTSRWRLSLSVGAYGVALFWYETGVFLPLILLCYVQLFHRAGRRAVAWFLVPVTLFAAWRWAATPGVGEAVAMRSVGLVNLRPLRDLFHWYAGFYVVRTTAYGVYNWARVPPPWLVVVAMGNILTLAGLWRMTAALERPVPTGKQVGFWGVVFACFLLPVFLQRQGGVAGRHLLLPSLAVAAGCLALCGRFPARWRQAYCVGVGVGLIVAQGTALAQVQATRINGALYATLRERKGGLATARNVVIDLRSFADNIPATWLPLEWDVLNTYYGAQAFEEWGLRSMAALALGERGRSVHLAVEAPRRRSDGSWTIVEGTGMGTRAFRREATTLPREGTVIIGFRDVFPAGFSIRPGA